MEKNVCEKQKCTGCFACMNICPKDAIEVAIDVSGKTVPNIIDKKCVRCGLCSKRCPSNTQSEFNYPISCFATQWKSEDRLFCSSGGIATAIYEYCLKTDIHVFGCLFDEKFNLVIRELKNYDDVKRATGSKYVQSSVGYVYREVKSIIDSGERALFIGTPCQIDGLIHFFGNKPQNLITIDIICHGTPPLKYLKDYVKSLGKKNVNRASFRGKDDYYLCLYSIDKLLYKKWQRRDLFYQAYNEGIINRDNCYGCRYASPKRVSDITIGDFWGLNRETLSKEMRGKISVVLLNTEGGKEFWNLINSIFVYEERSVAEAISGNPHLKKAIEKNIRVKTFEANYPSHGFKKAILKTGIRKRMLRIAAREYKSRIFKCVEN